MRCALCWALSGTASGTPRPPSGLGASALERGLGAVMGAELAAEDR